MRIEYVLPLTKLVAVKVNVGRGGSGSSGSSGVSFGHWVNDGVHGGRGLRGVLV